MSVLACNLLMAAYEEDENWPEIFVKARGSRVGRGPSCWLSPRAWGFLAAPGVGSAVPGVGCSWWRESGPLPQGDGEAAVRRRDRCASRPLAEFGGRGTRCLFLRGTFATLER